MAKQDICMIQRALLSVSDKDGLVAFARVLVSRGIRLVSTGNTGLVLRQACLSVQEIDDFTGFPEILGGRVKTLHPRVHGAILYHDALPDHRVDRDRHGIEPIDLVVVNLYPFCEIVRRGANEADAIEHIDIGGVALARAAAKNWQRVAIVTSPDQYEMVGAEIARHGGLSAHLRRSLAGQAFALTAEYDRQIAQWYGSSGDKSDAVWPDTLHLTLRRHMQLRYGENPHQPAALYYQAGEEPNRRILQGHEPSYNNLYDVDAAISLVREFTAPCAVIVKHATPCGVACARDLAAAWRIALGCDQQSAFGGVVAVNRVVDAATAGLMGEMFLELIAAPGFSDEARVILGKRKGLRLIEQLAWDSAVTGGKSWRSLASGGWLVQASDDVPISGDKMKLLCGARPDEEVMASLLFAMRVARHTHSNAIVLARRLATVGISGGQTSRVGAARQASVAAGRGSVGEVPLVAASDGFLPFPDTIEVLAEAGVSALIQPGGSKRDGEVMAAAERAGMVMIFSGQRHFRH